MRTGANHLSAAMSALGFSNLGRAIQERAERRRSEKTLVAVRAAIERGRVGLHYQPIVHGGNPQKVIYYEALLRLFDGRGRAIPNAQFMPLVEDLELGRILDCLSLQLGLAALRENPNLCLAVNMSARSIAMTNWMTILSGALRADKTLGRRLIVEITEASAMPEVSIAERFMKSLQRRGIAIALDDFGSGHTAFSYFCDFRFDIVKVDGRFIRDIDSDSDNQVLLSALASIAQHFNMFTVAEQVETKAETDYLRACHIDSMQGYYFARPVAAPEWQECLYLTSDMRARD